MSDNTDETLDRLKELDSEIEAVEGGLGWFRRTRRRWANFRIVWAMNVASTFAYIKFLFGKKIYLWVVSKGPVITAAGGQLWGAITAAFAGAVSAVTSIW